MHIQAHSMSLNFVNPYSIASESAAAAQRSGDVRKRLLKNSSAIEAQSDPEQSSFMAHWVDAYPGRNETEDEYRRADSAESDFA